MPSLSADARDLAISREAIAATSETSPRCIAGMTFSTAILATLSTPHFTLRNATSRIENLFSRSREPLSRRCGNAALGLPRQHPARIFGPKRADLVERRDLRCAQRQFGGGKIVVELLNRLGSDDHAHHPLALQEPGERDPRHRRLMRLGDRRHRIADVVGPLLVNARQ